MTVIQKRIMLVGSKGKEEVDAIFDSGSTYSCIQPVLARKLEVVLPLPEPKKFGTAEKGRTIIAKERVSLDFEVDGYRLSDEFMVTPELSDPAMIGAATLQKWRIKLDFEKEEVIVDPRVTKFRLL
jgi:hypothetical protein